DIYALSEFPQELLGAYDQEIGMWTYYPAKKSALCELVLYEEESDEEQTNICAVPGDYGKIVKIAINLEDRITKRENEKADKVEYDDFYFADGVLYFKAEYSAYDKETSIGWRQGYRRLHTDIYRLKIGESKAEVLYSY
ncbi:MAG: hypothetical protein K2J04_06310, partial [Lachnospiraceae bacterium]|nr:hypothetical protein [Lachnospiraceae bacterium]